MRYLDGNKPKNTYTVYKHINKINKKAYVGITSQKVYQRWENGVGYTLKTYFRNAIDKYGWENFEHKILYVGLTKQEASTKEQELIKKFNLQNPKYGYNIAKGGDVNCGWSLSEERKEILRKKFTGKKQSKETIEKMKKAHQNVKMTQETKDKISKANKGNKRPDMAIKRGAKSNYTTPVDQYDDEGNFIKSWECIIDACRQCGYSKSGITHCISGHCKSGNGFVWRAKGDSFDKFPTPYPSKNKIIVQYDLQNNFIKEWKSTSEASKSLNIPSSNIYVCLFGKVSQTHGFKFGFKYR